MINKPLLKIYAIKTAVHSQTAACKFCFISILQNHLIVNRMKSDEIIKNTIKIESKIKIVDIMVGKLKRIL